MPRWISTTVLWLGLASAAAGITLPPGFQDEVVLSGLQLPTAVRFSPDGRVFVAEKSGRILVFDGLGDPTPTLFADLRRQVFNAWDRGLLGFILHPDFPNTPWAYALYTHNALPGGSDPQWPSNDPDYAYDYCPDPPGSMVDGCVVTGRLSRLSVDGPNQVTEHVLIEDNWCQQFPSHSLGDLAFGADGALYVSGGEGASFGNIDWGQYGGTDPDPILAPIPRNPCGDPGGAMMPPSAEGGALRAQDLRTPGDPVSYGGTVLRVDPETGAALPDNPLWGGAAPDDDRVVAYGLRNPFRLAIRPGTTELWIGDVGWDGWEEINRVVDPTSLSIPNFGWPCFEGHLRQPAFDAANLTLCESLYAEMSDTKPVLASRHGQPLGDDPACNRASSSVAGLAFYGAGSGTYPSEYSNALFFSDYGRNCLWAMLPGEDGAPDPASLVTVGSGLPGPVTLAQGPDGDLFYVEVGGFGYLDGAVHRIRYTGTNHAPVAAVTADVTTGPAPLTVHFDASGSTDPDPGAVLTFAWDFDGDGEFDDATGTTPSFTFGAGTWLVRVHVTDAEGASSTAGITVSVDNTRPTAMIATPAPSERWSVGKVITFTGSALDAEEGALPPSSLRWQIVLLHCPGFDCHVHQVQQLVGVAGGEFLAPDHEYPSLLEIVLTAVDAGGLSHTTSVQLQPEVASLGFDSVPSGLSLAVGAASSVTPFSRDVIVGSRNSVAALSPQDVGGTVYTFDVWSDGAPQAHNVVALPGGGSWVAHFAGDTTTTTTSSTTTTETTSTSTTTSTTETTSTSTSTTSTTSETVPSTTTTTSLATVPSSTTTTTTTTSSTTTTETTSTSTTTSTTETTPTSTSTTSTTSETAPSTTTTTSLATVPSSTTTTTTTTSSTTTTETTSTSTTTSTTETTPTSTSTTSTTSETAPSTTTTTTVETLPSTTTTTTEATTTSTTSPTVETVPSTTTTTTSLATVPSSTTTTTTVVAPDSTTTTTPDTTTTSTSTTVPIRCGGDAQCDDGDPCTIDRCAADGCTALPLAGLEGARCAVDRISSGLCRPGDLSKAFSGVLHKRVRAARKAILAAESAGTPQRAKLLRVAERRMAALTRATKAAAGKPRLVPASCTDRIRQAASAAQQSIRLAASGS